jgi:hypothetical protein
MGEAKRRQAEIETIKTKPRTPHLVRQIKPLGTMPVMHFKNAAARAAALREGITDAAKAGPKFAHQVGIKATTVQFAAAPTMQPKQIRQVRLVVGRKLDRTEFADHALALAQINPNGFRTPSAKEKNWRSTSLIEQASEAAGLSEKRTAPDQSKRGIKKREARADANAINAALPGHAFARRIAAWFERLIAPVPPLVPQAAA